METETIAHHPTTSGFGIAVLRNLRSGTTFHVVRTHRGQYVVISNHESEVDARAQANVEWLADRRAA